MIRGGLVFSALIIGACQSPPSSYRHDEARVLSILADLDDVSMSPEDALANYDQDVVILAPGAHPVSGHDALRRHLSEFGNDGELIIKHNIHTLDSFADIVVAQGGVDGTLSPKDSDEVFPFKTHNIIIFRRQPKGDLKVWKVIYNSAPMDQTN